MPIISSLHTLELRIKNNPNMIMKILEKTNNLRHLKVSSSNLYLNGTQWEQIINTYLPRLETLQFRMSYSCPVDGYEEAINQLLNSFRSRFWIEERSWYIRCHPILGDWVNNTIFYTIPYAFSDFSFINKTWCKSTCQDTDDNWSYEQVKNLSYFDSFKSYYTDHPQARFPNVRHLSILRLFDYEFRMSVPELNKLQSLEIPRGIPLSFVQTLLDKTTRLYSLAFDDCMFTLNNSSIGRLDLLNNCDYLTRKQCDQLSRSSLIIRCETLLIKIENEGCLLPLLENMHNLHALKIQCGNDNWIQDKSVTNDKILETLRSYLPSTAEIGRDPIFEYHIRVWIP